MNAGEESKNLQSFINPLFNYQVYEQVPAFHINNKIPSVFSPKKNHHDLKHLPARNFFAVQESMLAGLLACDVPIQGVYYFDNTEIDTVSNNPMPDAGDRVRRMHIDMIESDEYSGLPMLILI